MSSTSGINSLLSSLASSSSTSGIDLSSLLQVASGASSSGIDVTTAVNAAVTAARAPEEIWESQQSTLQEQTTALEQLQSEVANLDNDLQSFNSISGPLSARTATSSDSTALSASASTGAAVGNHVVVVNKLATTATWSSETLSSTDTALSAGSFTLTPADGSSATISLADGDTLSDVADQINQGNYGVTASVITDASGARLAIVSNTSGTPSNFSVTSQAGAPLSFSNVVMGGNADLTVDGIELSSASNTVTGALSGVTLNLLNASAGTNISLGIAPDTTQVTTAINQLVTDYNTAIQDVNSQFTDSGSGEGVLASDSTVRNLQSQLMGILSYSDTPGSGSISTLADLGLSMQNDGTLVVSSSTLNSALQNNFSAVQSFFQGSSFNGFAGILDRQLTNFISPANGAFTVDLQSISSQISDLQSNITNFESNYITPLATQLQSDYSNAEILLQELPTEMKQISEELGSNSSNS